MIYVAFTMIYLLGSVGMSMWIKSDAGVQYTSDIPRYEQILAVVLWWVVIEATLIMIVVANLYDFTHRKSKIN